MDPTRIGIFDLAQKRMAWAEQRQAVLAKNIANANTPHFQPADVPAFAKTLSGVTGIGLAQTHSTHLSGSGAASAGLVKPRPTAKAPDGNAVQMDQQLTKVADTETAQSLTTTIYKKYMGLFGIALGKGGL